MAANATDKAPGAKTRGKKPAAAATKEKGASAPSSAGAAKTTQADGEPAVPGAADGTVTPSPAGDQAAQGDQQALKPMGMGMGRFPEGWRPLAPAAKSLDDAETMQTTALEPSGRPPEFEQWGMPEITEFPATLKLVNASPARVRVLAAKVWVLPGNEQTVQCLTAEQYSWMVRDLSARASSCRWTSTYGLKVTHEQN